jgi:predicted RNase H-like HicB family nuclease
MAAVIRIHALWDPDAKVWTAESEDVPGLVTEADTIEALTEKLRVLIPELLKANGITPQTENDELPFDVIAERHDSVRLAS